MWRFLLLGILAVSTAERWSRQTSDRQLSDWVPVSAPCLTCHPQQKGRSYDQDVAGTGSELPSILTPPPQQPIKHHSRSPLKRDNFYQASSHTGFFAQPQYNAENPKQFVQQQQQNFNAKTNNNQPIVQSSIRFKSNSPISDSSGFSSNIFQVGPQQYSQNLNQQSSHLLPINQFISGQFIAPHLRTQFSGNVNAPLFQHNLQPFNDFHLPPNPPVFFPPEPVDAPLQQQFNNNFYNQIPLLSGQNVGLNNPISNISFNNKQPTDDKGKEEIQLLYVPVETLHRQNQKGRNVNIVKSNENKKVEANNLQNNNFRASNQSPVSNSGDLKTLKQIYQEKNVESGEQYFKQSQSIPENLQQHNLPAIQETSAPQIQQNSFSQPIFQEQISFGQGVNNQQQEIITSSPSSNNNNNIQYEQFQRDNTFSVNNPQITHSYQQESVNGHFKSADPKYETSNKNYYQSQQHSQKSESNFNPEYVQQDADNQEGTTPAPHQPPLSVYMENNPHSKITDVLAHLKTAKTIPVLDTFGPDSPQVFVGPSNLSPPSGYLKFELPYLSSLDNNRVERKVDQLPFFVAPLNFQPPPGYSKIPFPAPHIGSVVVSNATVFKAALHEKPGEVFQFETTTIPYETNQYTVPSNISPISPSLVNSLQDERYIPTTEIPTTTLLSTTQVYTTPRRRVPTRGSHRSYTTTPTTEHSITRRPSTRQRRPNNRPNSSFRNQQAETTISTQEPVVSTTVNSPFYEEKNREQYIYVEKQSEYPQTSNQNYRQPNIDSNNQKHQESPENQNEQQQFYNEQSNFNVHQNNKFPTNVQNVNNVLQPQSIPQSDISELEQQKQFHSPLQNQQQYIQGIQEEKQINIPQQQQQFKTAETDLRPTVPQQKYTQYLQENYELPQSNSNSDKQNPVINGNYYQNNENDYIPQKELVSDSPNTESTFKETTQHALENNSENDNKFNNFRRDPLRQRFRGKSHYQTTTDHPTRNTEIVQLRKRAKHRPQHNQNVQIVNDDSYNHKFNYPTNTERIDEQSTEHNEELQYNPNTNNKNYFNNDEQQFVNIQGAHAKNRPSLSDNGQFYQEQYTREEQFEGFKQNDQNLSNGQEKLTEAIQTQGNLNVQPQYQFDLNQNQQSSKEQQFNVELENSTPQSYVRETTPISVPNFHNSQQIFSDSSSKYDEIDQVTEKPINQQRLVKYTRIQGSTINPNLETDVVKESNGDQINVYNKDSSSVQQNNYNTQLANNQFSNQDFNEPITEAEPVQVTTTTTTENPPLVRVRGRVRNRQRLNGLKYTATTDAPNYPAGTNVEDHSDSQFVRKSQHHRINYSERNNRKTSKFKNSNLHSNLNRDNHENSELESSSRHTTISTDNDEVSVSKTVDFTTTEIPVSRKYNHILNRNIVRRPVSSRTSNQGTTSTSSLTGSTSKYLVRTTRRPTTQVTRLTEGGARIRRPNKLITTTSTTEYPPSNVKQDHFPPSAASNEVLDPYYPQKDNYNNHQTPSYNRQSYQTVNRNPSKQYTHPSYETSTFLTPTPFSPPPTSNNNENYWDDIVTIQQSNSYDFSAESSPVTHSTLSTLHKFQDEEYDQKSSPVFKNPSPVYNNDDQTPFSSNDQYIATRSKNKLISPVYSGKENQFSEKEVDRRLVHNEKESIDSINQSQEEYRYPQEQQNYNNKDVNNYYTPQVNNKETLAVTERPHSQTVFPRDSIPEQTENNKQFSIMNINDQEKTDHKSDLTDEESQFNQESIEDTYNENDNFKKNVDGKPINPVNSKKAGKRRGSWVRVRVNKKSKDVFETAESQNLASISNENTIKSNEGKGEFVKENYVPANHRPTDLYNTENPQTIQSPSTIVTTSTENPTESKNANNIQKQKSLTEMIRDIINSEDISNEEEDSEIHEEVNNFDIGKVNKNANPNNTIPTTSQPNLKIDVSETTVTFIPENLAVTVIPDINQVSTEGVESITALPEIVTSEINTEESKVLGTSTTTEISLETEICYRGRCIKSKKNNKKQIKPLFGSYKTSKLSLSDVKQTDLESDLMPVE